MADTQRTLAALVALFVDNITGLISPQKLRDFLVSALGGYGAIYVTGGATPQVSITATPAKVTGFATNGISSGTTPSFTTDDITIGVAADYAVSGSFSFIGSSNSTFYIDVYLNGAPTGYGFERKLGTGSDVGSGPIAALITCAANDTVELYVSSPDGGTTITPTKASLIVKRAS